MIRPFVPPTGRFKGPEHYWKIMREAGDAGFTARDVAGCTNGVAFRTVKDYVRRLRLQGAIAPIGDATPRSGSKRATLYRVIASTPQAPVMRRDDYTGQRGRIQQAIWDHLRDGDDVTIQYLAIAASTAALAIKPRTVETYLRRLVKAGLVFVTVPYAKGVKGRRPGARAGTYRLKPSANTGPKPLKIIDDRVFDPNLCAFVGQAISSRGDVGADQVSA